MMVASLKSLTNLLGFSCGFPENWDILKKSCLKIILTGEEDVWAEREGLGRGMRNNVGWGWICDWGGYLVAKLWGIWLR